MLAPPLSEGASRLKQARLLALLIPAGLLGGALFSQYVGGLYPCEMCYWQRWPHAAAILLAIGAYLSRSNLKQSRILVMLAALAVAISGAIGVFHAGVEIGWWEGITQCTATGATSLQDIMNVPLVRCDQVQWEFLGVSMAGWNAIISLAGAAAIVALARKGA
ncbi:disulfide bond formation protein B [Sphingomonas sp. NSE70-1]|uniref:Disulfide bond formation protein B n=1 Tax=Sphingomonas caseinilyticus TaxID=2908205 RepID=A0ABT0RW12_9SPHN|nr:disulfide bond formation protein B [Sphingomonas caseinilyticus]MCL6699228.1 disulfide bond formation protein B [Sphingomonas caseinilyticus]